MKKFYWQSFFGGVTAGIIVAFLPYLIEPLGEVFTGFYTALANAFSAGGFPNLLLYFVAFAIWALPFFVIFLLLPASRRALQASKEKVLAVILSLICFKLGVLLAYGIWLLFAFAALSGSALIF